MTRKENSRSVLKMEKDGDTNSPLSKSEKSSTSSKDKMPALTWFYDKQNLRMAPSILAGLSPTEESRYRKEGARFIINLGTNMGLRCDTMATGVVYFHRFYMFHSFQSFPRYVTACGCLFLAGKVEETPKKCKDLIKFAKSHLTEAQFMQFGDDPKEEVMMIERVLLQTIKFDMQTEHPYSHLIKYAKCLKGDKSKLEKLVQMAWTFINDSLCTTLCLQWEPEIIAIALMYLAGKLSKFVVTDWNDKTPNQKYWWDIYVEDLTIDVLEDICHQVLDLYSTPAANTLPESPPSTPPSQSINRRSRKPSRLPIPEVVTLASSPVVAKPKDAVVGQPIPCLEPGELKRKSAKPLKSAPDAKISHLSKSSTSQSTSATSYSKTPSADAKNKKIESSESGKLVVGHSIPTIETAYHTVPGVVSSIPVVKAESIKTIVTKAESIVKIEKVPNQKSSYIPTESVNAFYAESHTSSVYQSSTYIESPASLSQNSPIITALPQQPTIPSYEDIYRPPVISQNQLPLHQNQYPPTPANIQPISPYPVPPFPQSTMLPNMAIPLPTLPQHPPSTSTTSSVRNDRALARPPRPPSHNIPSRNVAPRVPLPSQTVGAQPPPMIQRNTTPRFPTSPAFRPRIGNNSKPRGFNPQFQGEPRPRMAPMRGSHPPMYGQERLPRQEYSQFDQERSYRSNTDYKGNDSYTEYNNYGPSSHNYEYNQMNRQVNNMELYMPQNHGRPPHPSMLNNRPRLENPTGIPPVRITGRYPQCNRKFI